MFEFFYNNRADGETFVTQWALFILYVCDEYPTAKKIYLISIP